MLVDLHVPSGSCITHWAERGSERVSLWQHSAVWNQNQLHESCNGTITEHVVGDGEVAVFLFIRTSISHHINTLDNCCGSLVSPDHEILSCARGRPVKGAKNRNIPIFLTEASRHPHTDPELSISLPEGESPDISCGEAPWPRQAEHVCITLHFTASLYATLTCSATLHNRDIGTAYPEAMNRNIATIRGM